MNINIREFSAGDLKETAKLCRQSMHLDIMPDYLLKEKTLGDKNFDPSLTLLASDEANNDLTGFIQAVIRNRREGLAGYIKLLCVHTEKRRQGIAARLYEIVEERMRNAGVKTIKVYESWPNFLMPGVDPFYTEAVCFFERHGYKKFGDTSNLEAELTMQKFDTSEAENALRGFNIHIKRADQKDSGAVKDFIFKYFPNWEEEADAAFIHTIPTMHIAVQDNNVIAFSAYETNNLGTGWFGPMGTAPEARGKNIGGILLRRCLNDMKNMGYPKAVIPWVGPVPFYMHYSAARVKRVFWRYEKLI